MPRRSILSPTERAKLLLLPDAQDDLIKHYTLSEFDLSLIRQRRGDGNRLGYAVQLAYMRYPGLPLAVSGTPYGPLLRYIARQLNIDEEQWATYAQRATTRREHIGELQAAYGFTFFSAKHYRPAVDCLDDLAAQTDRGIVLAEALLDVLRTRKILLPTLNVVDRICAEAVTRSNRRIYRALSEALTNEQRRALDGLLALRQNGNITILSWLRQSPAAAKPKQMLEHIERLAVLRALQLPAGTDRLIHPNRLLRLAREGSNMTASNLAKFEDDRRYATLVAVVAEASATIIDEIVELHDRMIGAMFNRAKHLHQQQFQQSGKAINEKVRLYWQVGTALQQARDSGADAFAAIEGVLPWEAFLASVAEAQRLAQKENFDFLEQIGDSYAQVRRYAPAFLDALRLNAAPAAKDILSAITTLMRLNDSQSRTVPPDAPVSFVKKRWETLVFSGRSIDRRYYELCALSELKNAMRSGDIWVEGSRQFRDFNEYLLTTEQFSALRSTNQLALAVDTDCATYLGNRLALLETRLKEVDKLAAVDALPDASISEAGLKVSPLTNAVPPAADDLIQRIYAMLPRIKITDLLWEVDSWTDFTRHVTHLKNGEMARDKSMLLTVILADGINLGLTKMAEACPGTTYAKLSWLQAWHVRDETYAAALAELVNAQLRHPFAAHWGDGTTSSSDGQRFKAGSHAQASGNINPKYGSEPGTQFYTHISDQYAPFHTKVINVGVRDATYVLDGLLYHESDLRIEEHYTDTAGFTDHVFALMHLLGFRFAPRIRDLADKRLFVTGPASQYSALTPMIGGKINIKQIKSHWDEILRLAASIKHGTVTASLMLRKLGSYPRQNGLALALREFGKIGRTLFTLDWLVDVGLRRRVTTGLNKGEGRNALARAVFFNRLGEVRDRSFESQRYRASGLTLVTAAIVLWNTVYIERAVKALRQQGVKIDDQLLQHVSPLGWEHIALTGDYVWRRGGPEKGQEYWPLRPSGRP